ncbi:uncharacterized protein PV06_01024 [Exophiala oligosperma]|uniref:AB hydrolase-1 domain-containing protein n=1 Tax=Exophiala oligosperma TaxID=215243 RepID=A0A0D2CF02_9EURO|nr:uncharacterized protein PV06_01024 [Exophiala oligosperma]KIW48442.1 hypothetical protein PV06_01024 [Exophiala oligosperma]
MARFSSLGLAASACLLFSNAVHARPNAPSSKYPPGSSCAQFTVPVAVSSEIYYMDTSPRVDNNIECGDYVVDADTWTSPNVTERVTSVGQLNETFSINAQLCVPAKNAGKENILQVVTHGVGFDMRQVHELLYWDPDYKPEVYSYIMATLEAGYSILTYDRLGTGLSDKPDAYDVVQAQVQLQILKVMTEMARSGEISKMASSQLDSIPSFTKFVHVGHSFGSILTSALVAKYPDLTDGISLTGYIIATHANHPTGSWGWVLAREADPVKWADRGSGYLSLATLTQFQEAFISSSGGVFDAGASAFGYDIAQPSPIADFRTGFAIQGLKATDYKAPIQFLLAEYDFLLCGGNCVNNYNETLLRQVYYPSVSDFNITIQEGAGHGLTLHTNARKGYQAQFDFFDKNGL